MTLEQIKIVIVEDEPDTAEMFAEMMRLNGFIVKKVYGGTPAIALISHEIPDAVVLDVMMPDLDGCTFHDNHSTSAGSVRKCVPSAASNWMLPSSAPGSASSRKRQSAGLRRVQSAKRPMLWS